MSEERVQQLIRELELQPHVEGGYYSEYYRSSQRISVPGGSRTCSTAIYFLLSGETISKFHRLNSDEIWHFYEGAALNLYTLGPAGLTLTRLGKDAYQAVVPAGTWLAAEMSSPDSYALVGCTVAPGFEFEDFELADKDQLTADYPSQRELIQRLT